MRKEARKSAINSAMIKHVKTSNDKDRNALATQVRNLMKANAQLAQDKAIIQRELKDLKERLVENKKDDEARAKRESLTAKCDECKRAISHMVNRIKSLEDAELKAK